MATNKKGASQKGKPQDHKKKGGEHVKQSYNPTMVSIEGDELVIRFAPLEKGNPSTSTEGNFVHHSASPKVRAVGKNLHLIVTLYEKNVTKPRA